MKTFFHALLAAALLAMTGGLVGCGPSKSVERPENPEKPPAAEPATADSPPPIPATPDNPK